MIKKQYRRGTPGYFDNFIMRNDPNDSIENRLKPYRATIAKSKNKNYILNVKWQDPEKYLMFCLRWS
jgi:hypothetical protein